MINNPHLQWIAKPVLSRQFVKPSGFLARLLSILKGEIIWVENPVYRAWAEGYSKGFADGQIIALKEVLEGLDRIFGKKEDDKITP